MTGRHCQAHNSLLNRHGWVPGTLTVFELNQLEASEEIVAALKAEKEGCEGGSGTV